MTRDLQVCGLVWFEEASPLTLTLAPVPLVSSLKLASLEHQSFY